MKPGVSGLMEIFRAQCREGRPLVLATLVAAQGSTYRKPGARMLICADGRCHGLLGGGCFESDLLARAQRVFADGRPRIARYDMRAPDDALWGLGLGCNGAVDVLLQRLDAGNGYQPLAALDAALSAQEACVIATVVECGAPGALGAGALIGGRVHEWGELPRPLRGIVLADARTSLRDRRSRLTTRRAGEVEATVFHDCVTPPPHILILGAGEDAAPVARLARELGWPVTVADHRAGRDLEFAEAPVVAVSTPAEIAAVIGAGDYAAAVVMSHKLAQDRLYLSALARSAIPYVGLLGPAARRRSLLDALGAAARDLEGRCFGPAGLDIGADTPEEIALSIVAGIQSFLRGRPGGAFSRGAGPAAVSSQG